MRLHLHIIVCLLLLFTFRGQGWAAERFIGQARATTGDVAVGATVTVYDAGTLDESSIFSDSGLSSAKANPFTADANGQFFFYAADGTYDIVLSGGTPTLGTLTIADALLGPTSTGSGSVTSVALTVPSILSISGSPITSSGTLAVTLATQADNLVFAGPITSGPTAPTFRALVANDLPDLEDLNTSLGDGCLEVNSSVISAETCNSGTVTSVALTVPGIFSVAGSPITTSGTLAVSLASQNQNLVWASPDGSSGTPAFRALVANDIPSLATSKITSGTFADARISESSVVQHEGALTLDNLLGTLATTKGGTGLTTYTTGDLPYASAANTLSKLSGNTTTTKMVLTQTGTGSAAQAPVWEAFDLGDLAAVNALTLGLGDSATVTLTFDITVGTDPVLTATDGVLNLTTGALQVAGDDVVVDTLTLTAGTGLSGGGDLSANRTFTFDATELTNLTWSAGGSASILWTFDVSGTDTVMTFGNGTINVSTGVLQEGGSPVVVESLTLTGGTGIAAIGDLSANRTITFDPTEMTSFTWSAGGSASFTHTFNVSTGTDPVITYGNGVVNVSTGTLQQAGTAVALQSLTLTGGVGIDTLGDLSANRTVTWSPTELTNFTWSAGGSATITHTFNVSTGTDPTLTAGDNIISANGFFGVGSTTFAALGTPANGSLIYCSDCTTSGGPSDNTCTGSGSGAFAARVNGGWACFELDPFP